MEHSTEATTYKVTLAPAFQDLLDQLQASRSVAETPHNYKKGERQTVYPLKRHEDIINIANWLMENKSKKYVLAFVLGINVGLRANELLSLRMNQLFWPDGSVRFIEDMEDTSDGIEILQSKTKKYRTVFLNAECKAALEWYFPVRGACLYSEDFLFSSREGGSIHVDTFRKVLKEAALACGIKQNVGTHTCRKTWGWSQYKYNCDKANLDITMLQRAFGHSSPEVTLRYLGITEEEDKALYHNMVLRVVTDSQFYGGIY